MSTPYAAKGARGRATPLVLLLQVVAIAAVLTGAGALGGVLWEHWWTPARGEVQQGTWAVYSEAGLRADFSGVGLYVVVALVAGLVGGVLTGLLLDRAEVLSLVVLVVSALVGGWLMWKVGLHRGPPDPRALAASAPDGTMLPGALRLHSRVPFVSLPLGAVVGYAVVLLAVAKRGTVRRTPEPVAPSPVPVDWSGSSAGAAHPAPAPSYDVSPGRSQPPFPAPPPG